MISLLRDAHELVCRWVTKQTTTTGLSGISGGHKCIGVLKDNHLVAGFVYHDWNPSFGTIHMTLAAEAPKWASRGVIHELLAYPFETCKCQRITVNVDESNAKSLRLAEGVGFRAEAYHERAASDGGCMVTLRLFIEEWRAGRYYKGVTN